MKTAVVTVYAWSMILTAGLLVGNPAANAARLPPGVSISDVTVEEGTNRRARFTVSLDRKPLASRPVKVKVFTRNGSATAGSDFKAAKKTLTFKRGGPTSKVFVVHLIDDDVEEAAEGFSVKLSKARNARLIDKIGEGIILDNDGDSNPPPISINSTSASGLLPNNYSPVPERPQVLDSNHSVFAVNDLGMHCVDLDGRIANILPPFQVMLAQVVK